MTIVKAVNRRSVLTGLAAAASAPLLGGRARADVGPSGSVCSNLPPVAAAIAAPQRAVSLRQLSADLAAGRPAAFEKLTRLDGYIVDAENRDIVLWGISEPDQPNLFIEDFIVALRAAHGRYGVMRDNVNWITNPLISIDPVAAIFPQLSGLNLRTPEGQGRFRQVCATAQPVRIEGMPRNTRLAKVLVDADYRMKMVGQGSVRLPIQSAFPSHWEVRVQKWKAEVDDRQKLSGWHTRFWFQAGRFSHQVNEEGDTVFLDRAQVVLNDEDRDLTHNNYSASGRVDPVTRDWCCAWSARMDDVYKAEPIWRDMYNIFRHFAIARIMKDIDAIRRSGFDAQFLLERYEVPNVPMPATLPGLGRVELYVPPGSNAGTLAATNFICGGVSVGFAQPVERLPIMPATVSATRGVLPSRPDISQVSWTITPGAAGSRRPSSNAAPGRRFENIEFQ